MTFPNEPTDGTRAVDLVATWPVATAAAGMLCLDGAGPAPREVFVTGATDRPFEWASLTKLCTALALAVAVEETTVRLEHAAGPPGSTVAHLLAHASGLGPAGEILGPPGRRRIYSNEGFEAVGRHLARHAGMPYRQYLAEGVLGPLGMHGVEVPAAGSASHSLRGTLRDLLALAAELLCPTLISAPTLERATSVAFAGLDGVLPGFGLQRPCDWGLGFEIRGTKSPHYTGAANSPRTFGHFGQAGGMCWVDPVARAAAAVLTDRSFGGWAARAWPAFSDAALGARPGGAPVPSPSP